MKALEFWALIGIFLLFSNMAGFAPANDSYSASNIIFNPLSIDIALGDVRRFAVIFRFVDVLRLNLLKYFSCFFLVSNACLNSLVEINDVESFLHFQGALADSLYIHFYLPKQCGRPY